MTTLAPPDGDEILVIVGPTASGKTALALALAARFDGEIIGADSVQVYHHFDIGSGKPSHAERSTAAHHLVDCVDPLAPFDAARFVELAERAIADIRARGRCVIVCGGTFLWVKALLHGLAPTGPRDEAVRARHEATAQREGRAALHARLQAIDPDAAARLAPADLVRVSRALEIHELTGRTQTEWYAQHQFREQRHRGRLLGVARERDALDQRIEARTDRWLAEGWIDEVARLNHEGYGQARAMHAVGYRQVHEHVTGTLPKDELRAAIVRANRTFVRRQRTWLRDQTVTWLDPETVQGL